MAYGIANNLQTLSPRRLAQPCSLTCGRGVPTLACAACLCLYHPACAGYAAGPPTTPVLCKNCRKSSSPPLEPPPLTHKSGVTASSVPAAVPANVPRRLPVPVPVPVPVPKARPDKRVLLRMKVAGGGPDGERVWAVAKPPSQQPQLQPQLQSQMQSQLQPQLQPQMQPQLQPRPVASPRALALRAALPQSLAV
ncbi:uncharacterized protein ACR2FA_010112, partial [Aphomia sociella]